MRKKTGIYFICFCLVIVLGQLYSTSGFSQEEVNPDSGTMPVTGNPLTGDPVEGGPESVVLPTAKEKEKQGEKDKEKQQAKNVNIDARMLYGEYNNILTMLSIIQNLESFTYQLNSELKRSNDFGYENSSFYESEIGFTAKADLSETWKFIPTFQVNNESHGMFNNSVYSREEKDKIIVELKNEYKPDHPGIQRRWNFDLGGAQYVHRLVSAQNVDNSVESDFYKIDVEAGFEDVGSASNKWGIQCNYTEYFYSTQNTDESASNDRHVSSRLMLNFRLTEYLKIGVKAGADWDKDRNNFKGFLPAGKINITSSLAKSLSFELFCGYSLVSFKPEDFYFEQKFIMPTYTLPPGTVLHSGLKGKYSSSFKKGDKDSVYLKRIRFKGSGSVKKNNNFYNFYPIASGTVLSAQTIETYLVNAKADVAVDVRIYESKLKLGVNYQFLYFWADKNITYRPEHTVGGQIKYSGDGWELEWENTLLSEVYINPEASTELEKVVIGSVALQLQTFETFYVYLKFNNLYNTRYNYRDGYPEPGRTFLGGLRIII
ncbi:MAG: hypothetical protein GY754_34720 [bacterium]|nr:hypothetical protein [bacterium]